MSPAGDTSILHSHTNWLHTFPVEDMDQGLSLKAEMDAIPFSLEEERGCTPSHASSSSGNLMPLFRAIGLLQVSSRHHFRVQSIVLAQWKLSRKTSALRAAGPAGCPLVPSPQLSPGHPQHRGTKFQGEGRAFSASAWSAEGISAHLCSVKAPGPGRRPVGDLCSYRWVFGWVWALGRCLSLCLCSPAILSLLHSIPGIGESSTHH